jgi:hypothetical protein
MDAVAVTIGLSWTLIGLLCIALAIPLIKGKVPRNSLYGVRFPQSFQSDEAWLAINRYGGRRMILWAIPLIAVGVASFFLPLQSHPGFTLALGFAPLVFVLIPVIESWRFARRWRGSDA